MALPARAQPLLDDDWTIKPSSSQRYTITLAAPATVQIDIVGIKHAAKGFTVDMSDEGSEITRSYRRTVRWAAGAHIIEVKNTENLLNRITVHVRVASDQQLSARPPKPSQKVGQCVETTVTRLGTRLVGTPGSGTAIEFANGVGLVSYDTVPEAEASKSGDSVTLCLTDIPSDCPNGDERGRTYTVTNKRTQQKFSMQNSQHSCGGA